MKPPCEVIVKQILPAIRAALVKDLTERHKLNQLEIAKRLGISQPAVSQYRSQLRGASYSGLLKKQEISAGLKKLADAIAPHAQRVLVDRMNYHWKVKSLYKAHKLEYALEDSYFEDIEARLLKRLAHHGLEAELV